MPGIGSAILELLPCAKHIGIFSSCSGGGHRIQKWKETSPPTPQGNALVSIVGLSQALCIWGPHGMFLCGFFFFFFSK